MPQYWAALVVLSAGERRTLKKRARGAKTAHRDWLRAQIVLAAARGRANARIAAGLHVSVDTARKWRGRFAARGLDGLADLPRCGRPRRSSALDQAAVVALACQLPAATGVPLSRWSARQPASGCLTKPWRGVALARPLGHTAGMTFTTRMLTPETWDNFAALVEANNGVWGGCWCMGFHPEGVGAGHTREGNREAKRRHVARGTVHQVLVYDGDRCVGWCQFGSPPELPNIKNRGAYDRGAGDPPDWRIGCIFTNAKDRGKGVAAAAVAAALDEIKRAGGVVEAYPEQTEQRPPQRGAYLHTGPEELYARYGFTRVRKIAKWRWVMRTKI